MDIELNNLEFILPVTTWREWDNHGIHWEDYEVECKYVGKLASRLVLSRAASWKVKLVPGERFNDFFFDFSQTAPLAKPFVEWQGTEEVLRGYGLNGLLICRANEFYRPIFGSPLYSSDHFLQDGGESAKQVWRKLVRDGKAVYEPLEGRDRWRMI